MQPIPEQQQYGYSSSNREKERMRKKLGQLEKALGVVSHKPPAISAWVVVTDIRVSGPTSASTYVELETRSSRVKPQVQAAQLGGNTISWNEELQVWVDSQAEEWMFVTIRNRSMMGDDEVVGRPVKVDLKHLPHNCAVMQSADTGNNRVDLVIQVRPSNPRNKPNIPKGDGVTTMGDFNVPDARARLKKGGINDYCEFVPTVGRKYERGTISDYADFIVPSYGNTYKMKRGGLNDYAEFVLPRGYREQHGGINDYFTC